jgi:hypothetical protein
MSGDNFDGTVEKVIWLKRYIANYKGEILFKSIYEGWPI